MVFDRRFRPNDAFVACLGVFLALAPIPLGSNRPFFWALNAMAVGLLTFAWLCTTGLQAQRLRIPLSAFRWPALAFGLAIAFMMVQILPLPMLQAPATLWTEAGQALERTLPGVISVYPGATLWMILRYLSYGLLFFLVAQIAAEPHRALVLLRIVFALTVAHAGIAILFLFQFGDTLLFMPKWAYSGTATGFFVNKNSFATFLAFGTGAGSALLVAAIQSDRNRTRRRTVRFDDVLISFGLYGVGLVIILSALFLTGSRMGTFVGLIGLCLPPLVAIGRLDRRGWAGAIVLGLILVVTLLLMLSGKGLTERIGSLETATDERLLLYRQVLDLIRAGSWHGYGGGTFADAFQLAHRLPLSADVVWDAAHNLYLELIADLGVFALAPLAAVLLIAVPILRNPGIDPIRLSAAIAILIAAIHSLVDFSLQIEANAFVFITLIAAGWAKTRPHREAAADPGVAPEWALR